MYALLKTVHVLSIIVWIGGMSFAQFCLRPAAMRLDPPLRIALMHDALKKFFDIVVVAALLTVISGAWLIARIALASTRAGVAMAVPIEWHVMAAIGLVMVAIFAYLRLAPYRRLQRAVTASDWPAGAAALARIRTWVMVNLVLGVTIVVVTLQAGAA